MNANTVLVECAFIFAKHAGGKLDPRAAEMFERIFDLTVRPALARNPDQWAASKAGRIYALKTIARIGKEAAKRSKGRTITAAAVRSAAEAVIGVERDRFARPSFVEVPSPFCVTFDLGRGPGPVAS